MAAKQDAWIDPSYEVPASTSRYLKFEDGANTVRILAKPVMGMELWVQGKPVRKHLNETFSAQELANADVSTYTGERRKPSEFWAMPVWNYATKSVQIMQVNQKEIKTPLLNLVRNPKWGALSEYDVIITKGKDNKRVTYSVTPDPKTALEPEVKAAWAAVTVDMEKFFQGGHPIEDSSGGATYSEDEIDDIITE